MAAASSPGAVTRAKEKAGGAGLNGKGTRFFSTTIPQLHGHRAQRSHNSMGTALKKGVTPGDEAVMAGNFFSLGLMTNPTQASSDTPCPSRTFLCSYGKLCLLMLLFLLSFF